MEISSSPKSSLKKKRKKASNLAHLVGQFAPPLHAILNLSFEASATTSVNAKSAKIPLRTDFSNEADATSEVAEMSLMPILAHDTDLASEVTDVLSDPLLSNAAGSASAFAVLPLVSAVSEKTEATSEIVSEMSKIALNDNEDSDGRDEV